jgi:hypothetical protein
MDVNEWISYECSDERVACSQPEISFPLQIFGWGLHAEQAIDEGTCSTPNIRNSSTHSHASEGENRTRNRTRNRSKNCS